MRLRHACQATNPDVPAQERRCLSFARTLGLPKGCWVAAAAVLDQEGHIIHLIRRGLFLLPRAPRAAREKVSGKAD